MKYQDRKEVTEKFALKGIYYSIGAILIIAFLVSIIR